MNTVLLTLSMFFATVPMLGFLWTVWWLDRYDREPIWLVGFVFVWGALISALGSFVLNAMGSATLMQFMDAATADAVGAIVLAPIVEEPMKASVLLIVAASRSFDNATDGFVYGAAVGLGFAVTENFVYFSRFTDDPWTWVQVVAIRTACSGVMHAIASSVVGAALGWGRFRTMDLRIASFGIGMALAIGIHMLWNALAVLAGLGNGQAFIVDVAIFIGEFVLVFSVFLACLQGEHRMLLRELRVEADGGVLPPQHVAILASVRRRNRVGWCPDGVDQERYIKTATRLAFRRMQCRLRGNHQKHVHDEARRLRHELRAMLGTKPLPLT